MMDGYSVQDAASVLGVPEGRVWELLARGVLSGTPEGDSMRVFLKADAPAPPRPAPREELPRGNGNGGSQGGEASAFRELLTEFRNLTERYGQALLALGEARGEVAGLRSRVELLEARIDLRLSARMDAEPVSWAAPSMRELAPEAPVPEPPAPAEVEAVLPTPAPVERSARPRRTRSTRSVIAGFAEALARAQDPNLAPVGETAASEAAVEEEIAMGPVSESAASEVVAEEEVANAPVPELAASEVVAEEVAPLPIVEADAEPPPVAEAELDLAEVPTPASPVEVTYRPAEIEPDWFADGDFSWLDAAELEARQQPETVAVEVVSSPAAEPTLEIGAEAGAEPVAEPDAIAVPEFAAEPAIAPVGPESPALAPVGPESPATASVEPESPAIVSVEPESPAIASVEPESPAIASVEPEPAPAASAPVAGMQAVEVHGGGEEPVMWLGGQREAAEELEAAPRSYPGPTLSPRIRDAFEPVAWPATDRGAATAQAVAPPPLAMTEEELAQLARDEGWDEAEVSAIRAMISRPPSATVELPGSAELDEAISALQAVPIAPRSEVTPVNQWAKPATRESEPIGRDDWAFEVEPALPPVSFPRTPTPPRYDAPDPDWLRRRRGPAASAYRRIRRIFTG